MRALHVLEHPKILFTFGFRWQGRAGKPALAQMPVRYRQWPKFDLGLPKIGGKLVVSVSASISRPSHLLYDRMLYLCSAIPRDRDAVLI